jgi:uncharacterized membrane protein YeiH
MPVLDVLAVMVFAASGALVASRRGLDIVGYLWLATLTGVGGGTLRDLILDVPVFWVINPAPVAASLVTAVIVYYAAPKVESRYRLLLWFDALGLALFTLAGTAKGLDHGTGMLVSVVMGVITGTVGGILRDIVGGEPSVILKPEIYVTACVAGATSYVFLDAVSVMPTIAATASFLITFSIRGAAIAYNLRLPVKVRNPAKGSDQAGTDRTP